MARRLLLAENGVPPAEKVFLHGKKQNTQLHDRRRASFLLVGVT